MQWAYIINDFTCIDLVPDILHWDIDLRLLSNLRYCWSLSDLTCLLSKHWQCFHKTFHCVNKNNAGEQFQNFYLDVDVTFWRRGSDISNDVETDLLFHIREWGYCLILNTTAKRSHLDAVPLHFIFRRESRSEKWIGNYSIQTVDYRYSI